VKVAADPEHSADWLAEYVRNPRSKKPDSRMPMFQGKLNDGEFKSLIDYLASLK
jgi:cytochrome c2